VTGPADRAAQRALVERSLRARPGAVLYDAATSTLLDVASGKALPLDWARVAGVEERADSATRRPFLALLLESGIEIALGGGLRLEVLAAAPPAASATGRAGAPQLLAHVLLFQRLHGVPVEPQLLGHVPDRRGSTAPAHVEGEALGVEGIVGQEGERLPLHRATARAGHAPDLEVEVDPQVAAGEIPNAAAPAVVPPALPSTAGPTGRFFDRRARVMIRA